MSEEKKKILDARIENLMNFDIKKDFYESPISERKKWVRTWVGMAAYITSIDKKRLLSSDALKIVPRATPEEVKRMKTQNIKYDPWYFIRVNVIKEVIEIGIETLEKAFFLEVPFHVFKESYKRGLNKLKDVAVDKIGDKELMEEEGGG